MNKYVFLFPSMPMSGPPSPEVHAAWGAWFGSIGEQLVDGGNPFGASTAIAADGSTTTAAAGLGGYSIVTAGDLTAAAELAKGCPVLAAGGTVEVYEALAM